MSATKRSVWGIKPGDVICYPAAGRNETIHDFLRVTRVADGQIWGRRLKPTPLPPDSETDLEEWVRVEYTVTRVQIAANGVRVVDPATVAGEPGERQ